MKRNDLRRIRNLAAFFCGLYLTWRIFFTFPFGESALTVICAILLLGAEILGILEYFVSFHLLSQPREFPLPEVPDSAQWPEVDVFIATYNESRDILFKTISGCRRMEYPAPERVHIWLCDDGDRPEMALWRRKRASVI